MNRKKANILGAHVPQERETNKESILDVEGNDPVA